MSKSPNTFKFGSEECIPEKKMLDYMDNKLTPSQRHEVEKHLLDCELCFDAMEGMSLVKNRKKITELKKDVQYMVEHGGRKPGRIIKLDFRSKLAIAATLALLISSIAIFRYNLNQQKVVADKMGNKEDINPKLKEFTEPANNAPAEKIKTEDETITLSTNNSTKENLKTKSSPVTKKTEVLHEENVQDNSGPLLVDEEEISSTEATKTTSPVASSSSEGAAGASKMAMTESPEKKEEIIVRTQSASSEETSSVAKVFEQAESQSGKGEKKAMSSANNNESDIAQEVPFSANEIRMTDTVMATSKDKDQIFTIVEVMPSFPGGKDGLNKFIIKNYKNPNTSESPEKIDVSFVVNEDGSLTDIRLLREIKTCKECNEEALRLVKSMPAWIPGKQNGRPVKVRFKLPLYIEVK